MIINYLFENFFLSFYFLMTVVTSLFILYIGISNKVLKIKKIYSHQVNKLEKISFLTLLIILPSIRTISQLLTPNSDFVESKLILS